MRYENIASWFDSVVATVGDDSKIDLNVINEKDGSVGVFTDVNIATLNEYVDGSFQKAFYVTARFYLPYSTVMSVAVNDDAQEYVAAVMDKISEIEVSGCAPGYPVLPNGLNVDYIECLDNDPGIEAVSEDENVACYAFQFRIIYRDERYKND